MSNLSAQLKHCTILLLLLLIKKSCLYGVVTDFWFVTHLKIFLYGEVR